MTEAALDACASALDLGPCQLPDGAPVACRFQGSLPGGAACTDGIQCASGGCDNHVRISTVGPLNTPTCGTCGPIVGLGQVCAGQGVSAGCAPDQTCLIVPGMESSATPTYTCTAIVEGDVGAACDGDTATCKAGLYCAPACDGGPNCWTGKCSKLGEAGAPCGTGGTAPGSGGCLAPFECVGLPEGPRCSSGSAGSFCLYDDYCGNGLGCAPGPCSPTNARIGCASSGTCEPITWGVPGQTCDGYKSRCLVGSCNFGPYFPFVPGDGGALSGTCPTVVPDGQACTMNDTCDTLSECFEGKCALVDSVVCTGGDADGAAMGEAGEGGEGG